MMKKVLTIAAFAVFLIGGTVQALLIPLNPIEDAYVDQGNPATGYGSSNNLRVQGQGTDWSNPTKPVTYSVQRIFLQFDISSVPEGSVLTFAEFGIYLNGQSGAPKPAMQLWDLNNNGWDESLTWNSSQTLQANKTTIGISQSADNERYYVWSWSDLNPDADNPWDYANELAAGKASFMLTVEVEDSFSFAQFNSEESGSNRPYLKLAYIPEPATMALLVMGMGAMASLRKKK